MKQTLVSSPMIYELGEILGQGSNGTVFKAVRYDSGRQIRQAVAIKILNSRKSVENWRNEFASLSSVQSKFCVRVYGFDWLRDQPALVLELIDGITLGEMARYSKLSVDEALCIGGQIAAGLKVLHAGGMCHGDLSPNNVLVDRHGQVKLVDFGFGNTIRGRRKLTAEFAAPEALGGSDPDRFSDLWSLGKVLEAVGAGEEMINALLAEVPVERRWAHACGAGTGAVRRRLGKKVRMTQDRRRLTKTQTQHSVKARMPLSRLVAATVTVAALLGLNSSVGVTEPNSARAQVIIRSQYGVEIHWQGRSVGYAPMDLLDLAPGKYDLRWINGTGGGRRTLTLRSGESIVIDDKTFGDSRHRRGFFDSSRRSFDRYHPRSD